MYTGDSCLYRIIEDILRYISYLALICRQVNIAYFSLMFKTFTF